MAPVTTPRTGAPPDAGVIEEARARERHHRLALASIAVLAAGLALGFWGAAGGGSAHPSAAASRGAAPARASRRGRGSCAAVYGASLKGRPSRSLLAVLGVLRRPASAADALPAGVAYSGDPYVNYVRRTQVIGGRSYYVYPALSGCRPGHQGIMDLATNVDLGNGVRGGDGGGDASASDIEEGRDASTGSPGSKTSATITMLVPDGVTSVTLRYPAGRASGYSPTVSPPFTLTATPVNNELVVRVPRSAGGGPIWDPTMIWRGARGEIIHEFHHL